MPLANGGCIVDMENYLILAIRRNAAQRELWANHEATGIDDLAEAMSEYYARHCPELETPYGEMLFLTINRLDWHAIAMEVRK